MATVDFETFAPEPFLLGSPVCRQIEAIAAENLLDTLIAGDSIKLFFGKVLYGNDLGNLRGTYATYLRFKPPYTNCLIINSPKVPEISGMFTGTSDRKRAHRPLCGQAVPGSWHNGDINAQRKIETLERTSGIKLSKVDSYFNLLISIFEFNHLHDILGSSFEENVTLYSEKLRALHILS